MISSKPAQPLYQNHPTQNFDGPSNFQLKLSTTIQHNMYNMHSSKKKKTLVKYADFFHYYSKPKQKGRKLKETKKNYRPVGCGFVYVRIHIKITAL